MSWDNNNDPWKGGSEPPDLDEAMKELKKKLSSFVGGKGGGSGQSNFKGFYNKIFSLVTVIVIAAWLLTGFYTVNDAERGIVLRFGQFHSVTQPGLRWKIPFPVDRVELINTNVTERYIYQGTMLTRDENIVRIDLAVQFRRTDPEAFLFNLRSPEDTLEDVTGSAIREVIGKGGAVIREISETTGAKIEINDEGLVSIAAVDQKSGNDALEWIKGIVEEPEIGKIYDGKVIKIMDFGAFVNFMGSTDGLVHISQLKIGRAHV